MKRTYESSTGNVTVLRKGYGQKAKRAKMMKPVPATAAAAAAAAAVAVRPKAEFKFVDNEIVVDLNSTPSITLLNAMASGAAVNEHVGREVLLKSIQANLVATATATTGLSQVARIMLVYDRQSNGAAPTITDILTNSNVHAVRNLNNRHRFKIFWDQMVVLPNRVTATESGQLELVLRYYRKLRHPQTFNSTATAVQGAITTGSLFLVCLGELASGATDGTMTGEIRIRFWDV